MSAHGDLADEALAEQLPVGRAFTGTRRVRLGDVTPKGRLRLDSLTRYTQDISNDDTTDAGLDDEPGWVVRSTVVDELVPARFAETLTFTTFCAGLAKRWADRRLTITGDHGAHYEVSTVWVCVDHEAGRPVPLTEQFLDLYATAAGDRPSSVRQRNPKIDSVAAGSIQAARWQLRKVDYDTLGHVNNAAYWAAVEEWLGEGPDGPRRFRTEYGAGVERRDSVEIRRAVLADPVALVLWWMTDEADDTAVSTAATASVVDLNPGLYA